VGVAVTGVRLVAGLAALASVACGRPRDDCDELVKTINHGVDRMRPLPQPDPKDVDAVVKERRELAKHYELLAQDVAALKLSDRRLRELARLYRDVTLKAVVALGKSADSLERRDHKESKRREESIAALIGAEGKLVGRITQRCAAR
jgi:hypothetical protein